MVALVYAAVAVAFAVSVKVYRRATAGAADHRRHDCPGIAASKADWPQFAAALAVVIAGVVAAFVGPSGAWLAAGIGLFIALVVYAAADTLRQRRVPLRA